ncbi:MAG TPA: class I SAM-dependent methyltransferase [Thermoplasmata archaeon]
MKVGRVEDMAQHLLRIRGRVTTEFLPDRGRVLEVGPGEAVFDRRGCEFVAINVSRRGDPQVLADGQALPFRDATFDAVVATEVIEHVRYPYKLLRELRRVVRPSGRVLLSTPNAATPVNRVALAVFGLFPDDRTLHEGQDVGHIHFFTRRSFLEAVRAGGFAVSREWDFLLQVLPGRYVYDTGFEQAFPNHAKAVLLELRPA